MTEMDNSILNMLKKEAMRQSIEEMDKSNIQEKHILDSGERRTFESGAVRDIQEGKGRCDLLPLDQICEWFGVISTERGTSDDKLNIKWSKYSEILFLINDFMKTRNCSSIREAVLIFSEGIYKTPFDAILELSKHYEEGAKKYDERNWEKGISLHCYVDSGIRHLTKYYRGDQDEPHDRAFLWNMFGLLWTYCNKPELDDLPKPKGDN